MNTSVPSVADTTLTLIILKKTAPAPAGATKEGTMTTITVTINIATGNKNEGNAQIAINIPEKDLTENPKHTNRTIIDKMHNLVYEATINYFSNNIPFKWSEED